MVNTVASPPRPSQWDSRQGVKAELEVDGATVRYVGSGTSGSTADAAAVRTDHVRAQFPPSLPPSQARDPHTRSGG